MRPAADRSHGGVRSGDSVLLVLLRRFRLYRHRFCFQASVAWPRISEVFGRQSSNPSTSIEDDITYSFATNSFLSYMLIPLSQVLTSRWHDIQDRCWLPRRAAVAFIAVKGDRAGVDLDLRPVKVNVGQRRDQAVFVDHRRH